MLRAVIIDDEPAGIKAIRQLAERNTGLLKVVAAAQYANAGITLIEDYRPDVVFLDINMPETDGFALLEKLSFRNFRLVFTTAHHEFGIQAIRNNAFDYLLKPISEEDFDQCLQRLINNTPTHAINVGETHLYIQVKTKEGVIYIRQKEIVRLEASGSYTEIHLDNGTKQIASKGLKEFDHLLDPALFYRCHKSHIINLHKVQRFVNYEGIYVQMHDGSKVDIARSAKDQLLERLSAL
jgi:two-component system, LytTR family, response regulator